MKNTPIVNRPRQIHLLDSDALGAGEVGLALVDGAIGARSKLAPAPAVVVERYVEQGWAEEFQQPNASKRG